MSKSKWGIESLITAVLSFIFGCKQRHQGCFQGIAYNKPDNQHFRLA